MDEDGVCNDCVDNRPEGAEMVRVVMTMGGVTYAFTTQEHARQALLADPLSWACMAVEAEGDKRKMLKEKGETFADLPTFH